MLAAIVILAAVSWMAFVFWCACRLAAIDSAREETTETWDVAEPEKQMYIPQAKRERPGDGNVLAV